MLWGRDGNDTVRGLLHEILQKTDFMIREIEESDAAELRLLDELDKKAGELSRILSEQKQQSAWRLERLRRPSFE